MSANATATPSKKLDRRTRRSRDTLGEALMQLIEEQPFSSITVQDVLDRAGVGRTTFYKHYRDKQDLFLSDVEDFLEMMSALLDRRKAPAQRIAPVEELFTHIADVRDFVKALTASGKFQDVRELGLGFFARSIELRLAAAGVALPAPELRLRAHALAGAMFSMLDYWIQQPAPPSPAEMDKLFHQIAWQGLG